MFILNRYFKAMGEVIEGAGGRVDKFIGDGIMALFGLESDAAAASRAALEAARGMAQALDLLNRDLAVELEEPLRMGIGLHLGPVILGEMGHGPAASLTAIGDTVNVASRLEALTKEFACMVVVSAQLVERAGVHLVGGAAARAGSARAGRVASRSGWWWMAPACRQALARADLGHGGETCCRIGRCVSWA